MGVDGGHDGFDRRLRLHRGHHFGDQLESIRAAVRGRLINVLVTDDRTATRLLND